MKTQANSFLYALVRDALKHIFLYLKYTKTRALSVILKVYCGFFKNRCQETACLQAREGLKKKLPLNMLNIDYRTKA